MKEKMIKIVAIILSIIVIMNFVLLILGRTNIAVFWIIMILSAISAYVIIPRVKK